MAIAESDLPYLGESFSLDEILVVSPAWGRLRPGQVSGGEVLEQGAVIGFLTERGEDNLPLVSHVGAVFVRWFVREGERVRPGRRLALLYAPKDRRCS